MYIHTRIQVDDDFPSSLMAEMIPGTHLPKMSELLLPLYQYDVLLERLQLDPDGDVRQHVLDLMHGPGREAREKGDWALSILLPNIVRQQMYELLLLPLRRGATVGGQAVKVAAGGPSNATYYLEQLFAHGWDINRAISEYQAPVLGCVSLPRRLQWRLIA